MQSLGATCRNWTWSWSFINQSSRQVIFGAWDKDTSGGRAMILDEAWRTSTAGRRNAGYSEAREYLRLVEEEGYDLLTFPMIFSAELQGTDGLGPARIKAFGREVSRKSLIRVGPRWYAADDEFMPPIAEELEQPMLYGEGAQRTITINAFERSRAARAACLAHYGRRCCVCDFEGIDVYGAIGDGVIHVHHVIPVADMKREYVLDAIRDLRPVCPNCHAVIHSTRPALTIAQLRSALGREEGAKSALDVNDKEVVHRG